MPTHGGLDPIAQVEEFQLWVWRRPRVTLRLPEDFQLAGPQTPERVPRSQQCLPLLFPRLGTRGGAQASVRGGLVERRRPR